MSTPYGTAARISTVIRPPEADTIALRAQCTVILGLQYLTNSGPSWQVLASLERSTVWPSNCDYIMMRMYGTTNRSVAMNVNSDQFAANIALLTGAPRFVRTTLTSWYSAYGWVYLWENGVLQGQNQHNISASPPTGYPRSFYVGVADWALPAYAFVFNSFLSQEAANALHDAPYGLLEADPGIKYFLPTLTPLKKPPFIINTGARF